MFFLNSILSAFVKNDGSPRLAMAGMLGAVLAAGSSPVVGILTLSTHFSRHRNTFSLRPGLVSLEMLSEILSGGVPALVTELASGVVFLVFNRLILSLAGNIGVAACGVLANLLLLVIAVYNGLAQGVQPLFGQAFARGEERNIRRLLRYALTMALVLSSLFTSRRCASRSS